MFLSKRYIQNIFQSLIFTPILFTASESLFSSSVKAGITYPKPVSVSELKLPIPFKNCAEMQRYFNAQAYKNKEDVRYQDFEKYDMEASFSESEFGSYEKTYCNEGYIIKRSLQGTRVCIGSLSASSIFNGSFDAKARVGKLIYTGEVKSGNPTCRWRD